MGNWLMRSWRMPEEINTTVREHHNSAYCGEYAPYANLVFIADQLLGAQGFGDGVRDTLPQSLLTALGLEQSQLDDALERLNSSEAGLNSIIQQLAA
ncbi:hypothetical protein BOW53_09530 [Solemya pervernicosa gill symbiont]|uniref:HDOD domain-containing protein n=2 Tax=Gammaproteobacteria incertae sedis TaxID=118884 RepID=A0A1T2L4C2_9GAMM|nr:hypothetical protein BOW53_09530 [Solemya pervernicosa gill symbiont]